MPLDKVGGPGHSFHSANKDLYALSPDQQSVWRFHHDNNEWQRVGGPASELAVAGETMFAITPDRTGVWRYNGTGEDWTEVGGGMHHLVGGGNQMYGIAENGDVFVLRDDNFTRIGGPGFKFVATQDYLIAISPNRDGVFAYYGDEWRQIGGPAADIIAGNGHVYSICISVIYEPGDIYEWEVGQPNVWRKVGGPGKQFAVVEDGLFGLSPNGEELFRDDSFRGDAWQRVDNAVNQLIGHGKHLYAIVPNGDICKFVL